MERRMVAHRMVQRGYMKMAMRVGIFTFIKMAKQRTWQERNDHRLKSDSTSDVYVCEFSVKSAVAAMSRSRDVADMI